MTELEEVWTRWQKDALHVMLMTIAAFPPETLEAAEPGDAIIDQIRSKPVPLRVKLTTKPTQVKQHAEVVTVVGPDYAIDDWKIAAHATLAMLGWLLKMGLDKYAVVVLDSNSMGTTFANGKESDDVEYWDSLYPVTSPGEAGKA
jgi:hypothetical protein